MPISKTRFALLIFLGVLLIGVGFSCVYRVAWSDIQRTDYTVYTAAGQAVLDHTDLYEAQNVRGWKYVYPPPFALLMVIFAKMPLAWGALLWYVLEIATIAATSWMSVNLLGPLVQSRHKDLLYSLPLFSLCVILVGGAMRCQASIFMFGLMVATFYFHFKKRPFASGVSLAAAALLKVFPLVLVIYFVWRRQWKVVFATCSALLVVGLLIPSLFLGWQQNMHNIQRWVDVVGRPALMSNAERAATTPLYDQLMDTKKPRNQSLESLFLSAKMSPEASKHLMTVSAGVMLLLMLWAGRKARSQLDELTLAGAFISWSLLIPPISENHYFGGLIMPITILLARALYEKKKHQTFGNRFIFIGSVFMSAMMLMLSWEKTETLRPLALASLAIWIASLYSIFAANKDGAPHTISAG